MEAMKTLAINLVHVVGLIAGGAIVGGALGEMFGSVSVGALFGSFIGGFVGGMSCVHWEANE